MPAKRECESYPKVPGTERYGNSLPLSTQRTTVKSDRNRNSEFIGQLRAFGVTNVVVAGNGLDRTGVGGIQTIQAFKTEIEE